MPRPSDTVPGSGGSRKLSPEYVAGRAALGKKGGKTQPVAVVITPQAQPNAITRLGTPTALIMLFGLFLVYYALHGFDAKYGTFSGAFAGKGSVPTGTKVRDAVAVPVAVVPPKLKSVGT